MFILCWSCRNFYYPLRPLNLCSSPYNGTMHDVCHFSAISFADNLCSACTEKYGIIELDIRGRYLRFHTAGPGPFLHTRRRKAPDDVSFFISVSKKFYPSEEHSETKLKLVSLSFRIIKDMYYLSLELAEG